MRTALAELNEQLEQRWGVRLQARTGVNTGEVIAGDSSRGQGFATGDAVNVAARLEQAARPRRDPDRRAHARARARRGPGRARAAAGPQGKERARAGVPPGRRRGSAADASRAWTRRWSGASASWPQLRGAFDRTVAERTCELVTIVGPAGHRQVPAGRATSRTRCAGRPRSSPAAASPTGRASRSGRCARSWRSSPGPRTARAPRRRRPGSRGCCPADDDTATIVERVAGALGLSDAAAYPAETFWAVRKLLEAAAAGGRSSSSSRTSTGPSPPSST